MSTVTAQPVSRDPRALLGPLLELAGRCPALQGGLAGAFDSHGQTHDLLRFRFKGPKAEHDPLRIGLFAALHGDEPAGA
ncbi:MAG: hypothetical protein H7Y06_08905, partial [Opitutaceae bacterium]|nr:hypothetical protein [Opitutaceae bacterium]